MQKVINGIAIFSGAVALGVVGLGGYVFIRKDAIIEDVKGKVLELPGIDDAEVEIVWDPPWTQDMMSEEGKMELGLI